MVVLPRAYNAFSRSYLHDRLKYTDAPDKREGKGVIYTVRIYDFMENFRDKIYILYYIDKTV